MFELGVSAEPGVTHTGCQVTQTPLWLCDVKLKDMTLTPSGMNLSDAERSVLLDQHLYPEKAFLQRWLDLAADRDIMHGYSKSKTRRAELVSSVLPCLFPTSSCHGTSTDARSRQNLSLTERLTCDVIRLEPGLPDTANIPVPQPPALLDQLSYVVIAM